MTELSIEEKSLLRETRRDLAQREIAPDGLYLFHPALHIDTKTNRIYVAVPIPKPMIVRGKPILDSAVMIVTKGDSFPMTADNLESRHIFPTSTPFLSIPCRWKLWEEFAKKIGEDVKISEASFFVKSHEFVALERSNDDVKTRDAACDLIPPLQAYLALREAIEYFVSFKDSRHYELCVLWVMMTYIHTIFNEVPFINLIGYRASGKSKVLSFLEKLCFNAEATANSSVPSIFRIVEKNHSTVLIDEAEKLTGSEKEPELRLLLNACYKKGGVVTRWNMETDKMDRHHVFAPVAIAAINQLEPTLASRCIPIFMIRTTGPQGDRRLTDASYPWEDAREELYRFIFSSAVSIEKIYLDHTNWGGLRCRNLEKWQGILSVAIYLDSLGGGGIFNRMLALAESEQEDETTMTDVEEALIRSLEELVTIDNYYLVRDIKEKLKTRLVNEGSGKIAETIFPRTVGSMLRKFDIKERQHTREGDAYRIEPSTIQEILSRYVPI